MNYSEAIAYIHGTNKFGRKLGLENISKLLELMGNPHNLLKVIHVAGTNGKGSTSAFISNILIESGYNVGLFSSPFLQIFNERIRLNRKNIPNQDLADITEFVKSNVKIMIEEGYEHPTEFEIVTAIAFEFYKREKVDFVVLEVGMGGRLDSTNIISNSICSVITPIAMDHMDYLGETLADIAYEKAGIIKENGLVILYPQEENAKIVVEQKCTEKKAELIKVNFDSIEIIKESLKGTKFKYNDKIYNISLLGRHQIKNAVLAINVANKIKEIHGEKISEESIIKALKITEWPGRMEIISKKPLIIIDGAHNYHGAESLKNTLQHLLKGRHVLGIVGILKDKDVENIIKSVIPLLDEVVVTEPNSDRKMDYLTLLKCVKKHHNNVSGFKRILEAVIDAKSRADEDDVILVFGSLYMIGEVRSILIE